MHKAERPSNYFKIIFGKEAEMLCCGTREQLCETEETLNTLNFNEKKEAGSIYQD